MGTLFFFFTCISLFGVSYFHQKGNKLFLKYTGITLYNGLTLFVYLLSRELSNILESSSLDPLFSYELQIGFIFLSIGIVLEWLSLTKIKNTFYKLFIPTFLNALTSFVLLFYVGFGIINVVWFLIFTGIFAVYIFLSTVFHKFQEIIEQTKKIADRTKKKEILEDIRSDLNLYIKVVSQGILGLGAAIGVSMSILFRQGEAAWNDLINLSHAVSILIAYGAVGLGFMIWFLKPYMDSYADVRYYFEEFGLKKL